MIDPLINFSYFFFDFLIYSDSEIEDALFFLPEDFFLDLIEYEISDSDSLDTLISLLSDINITVYEQAPDAETLLLNENAPTATTEEEAEEEAEAALSTVDSEFGRTTDPVRMYMREMGTVDLLTTTLKFLR